VYNIFEKLELAHAHYEANTMRPPSHSRPQPPLAAPTRSSHSFSMAKVVHSVTPILPSYNYCGNLAHKVNECNIPSENLFVIIVGKRDIMKLFILRSFHNGSNSNNHDKIGQHLLLPLNQKPRHLNLALMLSPPNVILIRMLKRRNTMLTRKSASSPCHLSSNSTK